MQQNNNIISTVFGSIDDMRLLLLFQALVGTTLNIPVLDGKTVALKLTDVVKPNTTRRIQGEGLPFPKQPNKRGDLIVEFDIQFPETLPRNVRDRIGEILPAARLS